MQTATINRGRTVSPVRGSSRFKQHNRRNLLVIRTQAAQRKRASQAIVGMFLIGGGFLLGNLYAIAQLRAAWQL